MKIRYIISLLLIFFCVTGFISAQAQGMEVSGTVIDGQSGETLPGVNISVKGTTRGTVTNAEGKYQVSVESPSDTLIFSFVGFKTQQIPINGRATIDVELQQQSLRGEELVVVGYGQEQRSDLTGSITNLSENDLEEVPASNIQDALAGKIPGVSVQQSGGSNPTGGSSIRVRGINSTNKSANSPLYVIDGVPLVDANLNAISPDNIESINVLKDASATAIYGSRAAAGVVIVTTKSGRPGETEISVSIEYGIQQITKTYDLINSQQWYDLMEQGWSLYEQNNPSVDRNNDRRYTDFFTSGIYDAENSQPLYNTNWQEALLTDQAPWSKYQMGVSGGTEDARYYVNLGYENREGIMVDTDQERLSLSSNFSVDVRDNLEVGLTANGSYVNAHTIGGLNNRFGTFMPTVYKPQWVPMKKDGEYVVASREWVVDPEFDIIPYRGRFEGENQRYDVETRNNKNARFRVISSFSLNYEPIKNLQLDTNLGLDIISNSYKNTGYLQPKKYFEQIPWAIDNVSVDRQFARKFNYTVDQTATYQNQFESHTVKGMVGFSMQVHNRDFLQLQVNGATDNDLDQISNQPNSDVEAPAGNVINRRDNFSGIPGDRLKLASYFTRINYDYDKRYFFTGTLRRDGSAKFAPGYRWGTFPSVSAAWNITNEDFMDDRLPFLNQLKIRASYGETGNQASVSSFNYLSLIGFGTSSYGKYSFPSNIANSSITWESVDQTNIGLDISLLNNRVELSADYYNKKTTDMLGQVPLTPSSGFGSAQGNVGKIENKGIELSLNTTNISTSDFNWQTSATFSLNRNKILDLGSNPDGSKRDSLITGTFIQRVGQPISEYYLYEFDGIWQEDPPSGNSFPSGYRQAGKMKIKDHNGDLAYNQEDRVVKGSPLPDFSGGFTNTFRYRNMSLQVVATYMIGNKLLNNTAGYLNNGHPLLQKSQDFYENSWTPENGNNKFESMSTLATNRHGLRATTLMLTMDRWLEDASFLKIRSINFDYQLPQNITDAFDVKGITIGASVTNVYTFTNYSGLDPETDGAIASGNVAFRGVDNGGYPSARSFILKFKMNF